MSESSIPSPSPRAVPRLLLVPPTPLEELQKALARRLDKDVFAHSLGIGKMEYVPKLAENMIVVCFDTESWVRDHDKLTEIGIATFDSLDMRTFESPGMYSENLLKQVYFYHARIEENAHLINIKYCPGDPDSNRSGQTRFVNSSDAMKMLESIFRWLVDAEQPELGFCPVIVMGHALSGDLAMLSRTLGVHAAVFDTAASIIDTQQLCRSPETGVEGQLFLPRSAYCLQRRRHDFDLCGTHGAAIRAED